jgi:xanthine dehydrogenase accessory factor
MVAGKNILVRSGGDFASGPIRKLNLAGARVVVTELSNPLNVRREVSFSEAVHREKMTVEGATAVLCEPEGIDEVLDSGNIALIVDPEGSILKTRKFDIVIDGIMAKKNTGTTIDDAPIVIGLGPGFCAGKDCHAVVETLAGHNLGRVIYSGEATPDTGMPAPPEYYLLVDQGIITPASATPCDAFVPPCSASVPSPCSASVPTPCSSGVQPEDLVIRSPVSGIFDSTRKIGDIVEAGDILGTFGDVEVVSKAKGVVRGLIHPGTEVAQGVKIGDIDPTCIVERAFTISEKANAIGGGVLEACLYLSNGKD